jgi:hypothetical protein
VKDAARLLRKLRRKVYRETPVASWNRAAEIDWHGSYDSLVSVFERGDCGVLSGGAAFALWRAATDAGFRAWCYDFGFPETLTHMVTVIEADGRLHLHDAFFNFEYRGDFYNIIEALRADRLPDIRRETRDRKLYVADPACEAQLSLDWLAAHADRELDHLGALRRFEVLWDGDAFVATCPRIEAVYRDLEAHGHPAELSYLMLHPIAVFDGEAHHRKRETMPLVGGRDLRSPVAGLRTAMHRLTQDLAAARAQLAAAAGEAGQLAQDKAALEHRRLALEAALAETNASHSGLSEQARRLEDQIVQLRSARDDIERAAAAAEAEWAQQRQELQDQARTLDENNHRLQATAAETRASLDAVRGEAEELRATIDRRGAEWDEERQRSREAAQALEGDVLRLREELAQTSAQLDNTQADGRKLRAEFERRSTQWADERRQAQAAAQALEGDVLRLREGLAQTSAQLGIEQTESAQLRAEFERRSAEWGDERRSLQSSLQALNQDAQAAFAEWARAQLNAEQAAAQATWSGLQVAELVEREATAADELAQARAETASLRARQSELGPAALELRERDQAVSGFAFGVGRLLGIDDLPGDDLAALLVRLRRHIRTLERDLDRAEAERGRLDAMLRQTPAQREPAAGRLRRLLRLLVRPSYQGKQLTNDQFVQSSQLSRRAS